MGITVYDKSINELSNVEVGELKDMRVCKREEEGGDRARGRELTARGTGGSLHIMKGGSGEWDISQAQYLPI